MNAERVQLLVGLRRACARPSLDAIARDTMRFAPGTATPAEWRDTVQSHMSEADERFGTSWRVIAERALPALALGVSDAKWSGDAWVAAIAARLLGLWRGGSPPSIGAVCDAFSWQRLGLTGTPKRLPPEVRALFLRHELAGAGGTVPARLLRQFVARELGAARPELRVIRDALVRAWLEDRSLAPSFVDGVRVASAEMKKGLFGDRKVFISAVWEELSRRPPWREMSLVEFKRRLLESHRSGQIVLARADLVSAMSPELVALSETLADGASFHFIVRESG